jgi:GxxExxY protein
MAYADLTRKIMGTAIEVHRQHLLVEHRIVLELKAIEQIAPIHEAVVPTYLKFSGI